MKVIGFIKKNTIIASASLVLLLILTNAGIIVFNKKVLKETTEIQLKSERAKSLVQQVWGDVVKNVDIGVRGYAIIQNESFLIPLKDGFQSRKYVFGQLDDLLKEQNFSDKEAILELNTAVLGFLNKQTEMLEMLKAGDRDGFDAAFQSDPGYAAWKVYERSSKMINEFEDKIHADAVARYDSVNTITTYVQILLLIVGMPTLIYMIITIIRDKKQRIKLFVELEQNNREYLFNPGTPLEIKDEKEVISNSIKNFKKAASFINQISMGNYQVDWEDLNSKNEVLNKSNLAGELIQMKQRMQVLKTEDEKRNWTTEGLAKFSEVIRNHQHNLQDLCYEVLVFLTKYLDAQQGAFFVLRENEDEKAYLELVSCFAFDKKKHMTKRIEIGQGLIGQTYLERQPVMITEIPQGYTAITSGLGEQTPTCILVVPMQYNEKVQAVIEVAGFDKFLQHQVEFMHRVGEITASTLGAVKTNEKTQVLLEQFQMQTEQLRAQEEEMRQNMEEMQATQEALKRQERVDGEY